MALTTALTVKRPMVGCGILALVIDLTRVFIPMAQYYAVVVAVVVAQKPVWSRNSTRDSSRRVSLPAARALAHVRVP
jgi:hypothetical protein